MSIIKFSRQRILLVLTVTGSIILIYLSGWREVGIDRSNYVEMYRGVITSEAWGVKLWYAKDLIFLIVTVISNYFNDDSKLAFVIICLFSVMTKFLAIRNIAPQYTPAFILLYAIFLSPGLEFAAMRAALAIGFIMLALSYRNKKFLCLIFSFFAAASHISSLLPIVFILGNVAQLLNKNKIWYLAITLGISFLGTTLLGLFPHGADYESNQGTVLAYSTPLATLIIAVLIHYKAKKVCIKHPNNLVYEFVCSIQPVIYGLIAIAFGISAVVVTAATRYLEISWCLMLFAAIVYYKKSYINLFGGLLLICFLSYMNILRVTWIAIFYPSFS